MSPSSTPFSSDGSSKRPTQEQRALSWGDMPRGATWDLTDPPTKLTGDMTDVPILDIDTWVQRSVEEHQEEMARKGRITRPLNSFMLYQRANTEGSKENEHQSVRDRYKQLALIERDGHAEAHPDHKFKLNPRKKRSVAKPVADLKGPELSEHNTCDWSSVQGYERGTQIPISFPYPASHSKDILETVVAPVRDVFEEARFSVLVGLLGEPHYDLL
ncbi:hypothetical protein PENANT_c278G07050 [Penicillium antarcticum]|uniref:HMG box domain-containing protein n=1 Tax=Penicillium antarcticum TaxID=416450 RepID=A0A1V6NZI8_9EURO|nr:hypothetical protein PENANT_c278G07050 [Penicillium antarcticum]